MRDKPGLARAHYFAQPLGLLKRDIAQLGILALTAAGFELDLSDAENTRQWLLFDADVLDTVIGDRTR